MKHNARDYRGWLFLLSLLVLAADRITKWLVVQHIEVGSNIVLLPHIFAISHVENAGAAFSLFENSPSPSTVRWTLFAFSVIAAVVVLFCILRWGRRLSANSIAFALILAGALGNAYDRLRFGYVIDFLEVHIVHYHWPDFNIADSAVVVGGLLLFADALFQTKAQSERATGVES